MSNKNTIAFQLLRAVNLQEVELAEERAAHLATRQELSVALAERAHARAEVERLREALRLRGQHSRECDRLQGREVRCVCGLDAALAGKEKP